LRPGVGVIKHFFLSLLLTIRPNEPLSILTTKDMTEAYKK